MRAASAPVLALVTVLVASCGGSSSGPPGGGGTPTQHTLVDHEMASVAAGTFEGRIFTLPRAGTARYEIVDVPIQPGFNDAMDIAFEKDADFQTRLSTGATVPGYGFHGMVGSIVSEDISLAAGDYDMVVTCNNFSADCEFTATIRGTY